MISDRTIITVFRWGFVGYVVACVAGLIWLTVWLLERLR